MADFDDSFDPELGAACNRLAAWVEPLPEGMMIDPASQLTERDLALILRRLYATRLGDTAEDESASEPVRPQARPSVPITRR